MALAVPNFSEGRDEATIAAIETAFAPARVLDRHTDAVHNRTVLSLTRRAARAGRGAARGRSGMRASGSTSARSAASTRGSGRSTSARWSGSASRPRPLARELALEAALALGDLGVPVFLYGELASDPRRAERAFFRRGGSAALAERMRSGELRADFGPAEPHPTAGATLVTARPPLAAFNVELDTADTAVAVAVAAGLRESGGGLGGVRAIGVDLGDRAQVSTNVHDPIAVPLGAVIERVRLLAAEQGARPVAAEVVGLVPAGSLRGLPADVPLRGFDPARHVLENRLAGAADR